MKKSKKFAPTPKPKVELTGTHKILVDCIAEQTAVGEEEITLDSAFEEDLGFDELDGIELIMALEDALHIEWLDEEVFMACKTVGEMLTKLNELKPAPPPAD